MVEQEYNRIRELVSRYYDAETNQAEEKELTDFFLSRERNELPEDLREDSEMFIAIASLNEAPPKELLKEIEREAISERLKETTGSRKAMRYWWAAAAAILIGTVVGVSFLLKNKTPEKEEILLIAEETGDSVKSDYTGAFANEKKISIDGAHEQEAAQEYGMNSNPVSKEREKTAGGYRIIDDEKEATEILLAVNSQLERTMGRGAALRDNIRGLHDVMDKVNNELNRILL